MHQKLSMRAKRLFFMIAVMILSALTGMAQKKYALLVGISNYHVLDPNNQWNDIHGVNDIDLISLELRKQKFHLVELRDIAATKVKIVKELQNLNTATKKGDIIYLHFSMHGQPFDDALSAVKNDEAWDESLVPIDASFEYNEKYKGENHLVDDELNKYIGAIRHKVGTSGMVYVVVDACHAGESSRGDDPGRGTKRGFTAQKGKRFQPGDERPTYFTVSTEPGQSPVVYLEACKGKQVNTEMKFNGQYYGPMSYFIGQVIRENPMGKDTGWTEKVKNLMNKMGPQNQNMVIERSK